MDTRATVTLWLVLLAGPSFGETVQPPGPTGMAELDVCTEAPVRAWRIIRIGEARLALDDCERLKQPLEPPLRLEFSYFREVPGDAFAESAGEMLKRNLDTTAFAELESRLKEFNSAYQDIGDGDTYGLLYDSDQNFILTLNENVIARETGRDFARAYLQIWFGEDPFSSSLKEALLDQ